MSDVQKPAANDVASKIISNVNKVIVGKDEQIKLLMVALLVGGHVLLEDVPGTGKTKTARALAQSLDLKFKRIQFTIDLRRASPSRAARPPECSTGFKHSENLLYVVKSLLQS